MHLTRRGLLAGAAAMPVALSGLPARGQANWPANDIHVICGFAPGTGADIITRFFAERLRPFTKRSSVVENKPGAGATIAAEYVARAKPDGYTMLITPGSEFAGTPYLYKSLSHDPLKDFAPVTTLVRLPFILCVAQNSPINSVADFLKAMKEKGAKASYGYPNNLALVSGELLKARTGLESVQVAYKSTPDALNDLNNGVLDFIWADATFGLAQVAAGRLKMLAVTTRERSQLAPDTPTLQESGVPDYHVDAWFGAWYPAGTPQPIVTQTAKWLSEILAGDDAKTFFGTVARADLFPGTPESTAAFMKEEVARRAELYALAKIPRQ